MSWVAVAVVGGAVIGGVATNSAASKQAKSSQSAIDAQTYQYDQTREDQAPYRETGYRSLSALEEENGHPLDPNSVQMDPGYQFGLKQGQQAIDRKAAASGGRISGAALKAAAEYGTDYATQGYSTAYNRANQARSDRLNRLAALAGIGQTSAQQTGQVGAYTANAIGNVATAQGNAAGAAQIAQGNIWAGAGNQLASLYGRNTNTGGGTTAYSDFNNSPMASTLYSNGSLGD